MSFFWSLSNNMKETLPSGEICSSLHTYMTWSDQMPWIINRYHRNKRLENSTWLDGKLLNWTQFLAQILNVNIHCKNQTKCHTSCHRVFCCSPYTCIHSPLISTESRLSCVYIFLAPLASPPSWDVSSWQVKIEQINSFHSASLN